ncbi:MAG: hypothetical protein Q4C34_03830 [Bacteroidales bacterium]|nr:hypothetical protein [Bacteroidales bacterium]
MWLYIQQIFQLILSPARGWEDISESALPADEVQRRGLYPWLAITSLSEFLRLAYQPALTFWVALESAIAVAGAMFAALYIARIFLDMTLASHVDGTLNVGKVSVLTSYMIGIACLFRIIANAVPASLTLIYILPLISLLIIFRAVPFIGVRSDSPMTFLLLTAVATIIIPGALTSLLMLVIS